MQIDPDNHIVQLCARGMEMEGAGEREEAKSLFIQAWDESENDFEKFIAAHYVARHQTSVQEKLIWDNKALECAKRVSDDSLCGHFPSLYLNIGKCHEDLGHMDNARENYRMGLSFAHCLTDDGYGRMIRAGLEAGLKRSGIG